jgi:ubiquinone biosynthesis protein UbiJ
MLDALAAAALEAAINRYLDLALHQYPDEQANPQLRSLDGKVVAIDLQGLETTFYLAFSGERVHVQSHLQGEPDACISGTPLSLMRLRLQGRRQQQQSLFGGDVTISGEAELGRKVNALLDELDIDWEEQLSRLVGDVVAHEVGSRARAFGDWARQTLETLTEDGREYLHEEARLFVSHAELEPFLAAVDVLRDDVERLGKRIERLERQLTGAQS